MMEVNKLVLSEAGVRILFVTILLFSFTPGYSQTDSTREVKTGKRLKAVVIGSSIGYAVSLAGMYHLWYKSSERQSFRLFNDNAEWKQVDKAGHFFSGFYLNYGASRVMQWSGVHEKKSDLYGALASFAMLLPIEVFDGFSDEYGASTGDLLANSGGALFFLGQKALWKEVRLYPKFSYHPTYFAQRRPELLGNSAISEIFKDYNGQTYWISVDADKFFPFPKWLNLGLGYGAHEMVYARDQQNFGQNLDPHRQYYFSLDFDVTAIKTRSRALKTLLSLVNIVKVPGPTIEFSRKSTKFHLLYF